ncbi:Alpha/Beta hydrolase protein [Sparassis latifolia]
MATLATAPSNCCIKTVEHTGTARGTIEKIAGIDTYIVGTADPQDSRKIILFFADVYGPIFLNSQLIMDYWASNGYLVLAPDYFEGDAAGKYVGTPGFIMRDWAKPKMEKAVLMIPPWLKAVREQYGYCFGAPFVMDCVASDWISAGALAHPAFLDEPHFRRAKKPLLLSCAEVDHTFPAMNRRRAVDILVENKAKYHVQVFSGVARGFALRGNVNDPIAKWAKEKSAEGILSWFDLFIN